LQLTYGEKAYLRVLIRKKKKKKNFEEA